MPSTILCAFSVCFTEDGTTDSTSALRRRTVPAVSAYSANCSRKTKTLLVPSATVPSLGKIALDSFLTLSAKSSKALAP